MQKQISLQSKENTATQLKPLLIASFLRDNNVTTVELLKYINRVRGRRRKEAVEEDLSCFGDSNKPTIDDIAWNIVDDICHASILLGDSFIRNFQYVSPELKREVLLTLTSFIEVVRDLKSYIDKKNSEDK